MVRCKSCGKDNEDRYAFCLGCGAAASPRMREPERGAEPGAGGVMCPYCAAMNAPNFVFCSKCANRLDGRQASPEGATTFRDFAPRLAYALYIAHQQVTTRPDRRAHVAIIAGAILAAARCIQTRSAPSPAAIGGAPDLAITDGGFAPQDPLVVAYGQVAELFRAYGQSHHPRDDAGLSTASADPELAGRAQALADALRAH